MSIAIVLALFVIAVVVLSMERIPMEVFSLLLVVTLVITGILTPQQAFSGLASTTVVMIGGVMLLTGAIIHNGAADLIARRIGRIAGSSETRAGTLLIAAVNGLSAVINNVAATAVFIPVAEGIARRFGSSRSRYLMPVAFASMTGGMCTLIGTSTNIAVSGGLAARGLEPLGLFELAPVGVPVALAGALYLLWIAPKMIASRPRTTKMDSFEVREFLYEVIVRESSPLADRTIEQAALQEKLGMTVLALVRGEMRVDNPRADQMIRTGDLLLVKSDASRIPEVRAMRGLEIKAMPPLELDPAGNRLSEVTISYNSPLIGKSLKDVRFRQTWGVSVLAILHGEGVVVEKVGKIPLRAGDVLLAYGSPASFAQLAAAPSALVVEMVVPPLSNPRKSLQAIVVLLLAVGVATAGWLDAPTAFLGGAAIVLAIGCLPREQAGAHLNLPFLVMIAAMSSLGLAMETSGAAAFVTNGMLQLTGSDHPQIILAVLFATTVVLTQPLSNAAAALLVLPVALSTAGRLGLDPRPFAITVTLAASCSFITPFEPACLLVYSTGHYRFGDFLRVGAGLTLLSALVCLAIVPVFWPLTP